jgi:hypothetical protein
MENLRPAAVLPTIPYMISLTSKLRMHPRVPVSGLCNALVDEQDQYALLVDVSAHGLRLERPLRGRAEGGLVQLEFELPGVDEILWAKGEIRFDRLRLQGRAQAVRTTGVRIVAAASRHLGLLRDWVHAFADMPGVAYR